MSEELKSNVSAPKVESSIIKAEYLEHSKFGSIDDEGNVYVIQGDEKRFQLVSSLLMFLSVLLNFIFVVTLISKRKSLCLIHALSI